MVINRYVPMKKTRETVQEETSVNEHIWNIFIRQYDNVQYIFIKNKKNSQETVANAKQSR